MENKDTVKREEIDLYELLLTVKKRYKLLLITFLILSILSITIIAILPQKYEAVATINPDYVEYKSQIDIYKNILENLLSVKNKNDKDIILQLSNTINNDANTIISFIKSDYLKREIANKENINIKILKNIIDVSTQEGTGMINISVLFNNSQMAEKILSDCIYFLDTFLKEFYENSNRSYFYVIDPIHISNYGKPVFPKKGLLIIVSIVISIIFSLCLVFIVEFLERKKSR
jgi:capsular polysaccharide biosynthesis protein